MGRKIRSPAGRRIQVTTDDGYGSICPSTHTDHRPELTQANGNVLGSTAPLLGNQDASTADLWYDYDGPYRSDSDNDDSQSDQRTPPISKGPCGKRGKEEEERTKEEGELHRVPDGGYGWVIVLGCFISHVISGGLERSDGVFFVHFQEQFRASSQLTAWPGALGSALRFVVAPLAGMICARYSARTAVVAGGAFLSSGALLSGLAVNIYFLFFSYALLLGVGRGFATGPSLIIVNQYFDQHRAFAIGLGTAGVGVGTFVLVPCTEYLFHLYGFQGAFLILSALAFHVIMVAMLFRPLVLHRKFQAAARAKAKAQELSNVKSDLRQPPLHDTDEVDKQKQNDDDNNMHKRGNKNVADRPSQDTGTKVAGKDVENNVMRPLSLSQVGLQSSKHTRNSDTTHSVSSCDGKDIATGPVLETNLSAGNDEKDSENNKQVFQFHLLRNPSFLLFGTSILLFAMALKAAYMFIPALVRSHGFSASEAAFVLSFSGAVDTAGRIGTGFILDLPTLRAYRPFIFSGFLFALTGISLLVPLARTVFAYCVVCGAYGMCSGAYVSQKSVILVDMLGMGNISSSFGLLLCFQGLGTMLGGPLAGALEDVFGSYNGAYYLGAASMAVAGVLMVISNLLLWSRGETNLIS